MNFLKDSWYVKTCACSGPQGCFNCAWRNIRKENSPCIGGACPYYEFEIATFLNNHVWLIQLISYMVGALLGVALTYALLGRFA